MNTVHLWIFEFNYEFTYMGEAYADQKKLRIVAANQITFRKNTNEFRFLF